MSKYKEDIIELRKKGKSYREIENKLGCSRGTISYHCQNEGLEDIGKKQKKINKELSQKINRYSRNHTYEETSNKFNISRRTAVRHSNKKKTDKTSEIKKNIKVDLNKDTNRKGDIVETKIMSKLVYKGYNVSIPFGDNTRYDLIFEDNNRNLNRIQCKHGCYKENDSIVFNVSSCSPSNPDLYKTYHQEIDYFGVWSEYNDSTYLVPFNEVKNCKTKATLRTHKPKNGQIKNIRWAKNYKL